MTSSQHQKILDVIEEHLQRDDLDSVDILNLVIARRLHTCSDASFAEALGGADKPALNFWNKR